MNNDSIWPARFNSWNPKQPVLNGCLVKPTISQVKVWNHPIEPTIKIWLFRVPGWDDPKQVVARLPQRRPNDERFYDADENVDQAAVGCWMMLDFFGHRKLGLKVIGSVGYIRHTPRKNPIYK